MFALQAISYTKLQDLKNKFVAIKAEEYKYGAERNKIQLNLVHQKLEELETEAKEKGAPQDFVEEVNSEKLQVSGTINLINDRS